MVGSSLLKLLRHRYAQPIWQQLHRLSLVGMNYWASHLGATGELDVLRHVARRLREVEQPVVFDVGANLGDYSLACRDAFENQCTIHAFEPSPRTFAMLLEAIGDKAGDDLQLHPLGLSDHDGETTLFSSEPGSTIASVYQLDRPIRPFRDAYSESVRLTTLDGFCAKQGIEQIDFLKLDIEGHEYSALQGAANMLRDGRIRLLQFEFGENNTSSGTYLADFWKLLAEQFDIFRIVPGGLVPWSYEGGRSEIFATMNYFCELKGERRIRPMSAERYRRQPTARSECGQ